MESAMKGLFCLVFLITIDNPKRGNLTMKEIFQRQGVLYLTHMHAHTNMHKQNYLLLPFSCIRNTCNHLVFLISILSVFYMLSLPCISESFSISFPLLALCFTSCCPE